MEAIALHMHTKPKEYNRPTKEEMPTTKEVYALRKKLKGMVIGPLDKNKGEMWVACPTLYHKALRKAYSEEAGY